MKIFLTAFCCLFTFFTQAQITSSSEWTWVGGNSTRNQVGVYGTQGIADAANKPGSRQLSVSWTDATGNIWLFGGNGYDMNGSISRLNDLWRYNKTTNEWTWMSGDNIISQWGVYGTQGVADAGNKPGSRERSISFTDASGDLWLFGGLGLDINGSNGTLNDLWKYSTATNEWTWVNGDNVTYQMGVYGTQGIADAANKPGSRERSISWVDGSGNLWLFGGYGIDMNFSFSRLNDLWKYNTATNEWTWMSGDNIVDQWGVYGSQGIADAANKPGARYYSASWMDASNNLWLFGGTGYDGNGNASRLNDLWKYSTATNEWTWISGDNLNNQFGVYGSQGIADPANKPGSRERSTGETDASGNIWLFGGFGYDGTAGFGYLNDLWKYNITTNEWTWVKGDNNTSQSGIYGTQGIADPANKPGSRYYSLSWMDGSGNLWLFGGLGYDVNGFSGRENDLWKLSVDLITLPLHFLEFNGRLQNSNGFLSWKTENEQNTSNFEIERSTDGRNYTAVGNVNAFNQPGIHQYSYTDNNIVTLGVPVIYYRLKQKDKDGRFTWSRIVALSIDHSKNIILFYPNPVINETNLAITVNKKEKVQVRIIDNAGRIIKQQQMNLTEGSNTLLLDVSALTKGIYFLDLKGETINNQRKFVKQ